MSIGAAPNLSGGLSTISALDCCALPDSGNGTPLLGPSGTVAPLCNCGGGGSTGGGGGGGNGGGGSSTCCSAPGGAGTGPTPGGGGGSCGSGSSNATGLIPGSGALTASGIPPQCDFGCTEDMSQAAICCRLMQQQCLAQYGGGNGNLAPGTFAPIPPANAQPPVSGIGTGNVCAPPPPVAVPVGAVTPPPVIAFSSTESAVQLYDGTLGTDITGLPITCLQTGVTLTPTSCGAYLRFYVPSTGFFTFACPGGLGTDCAGGSPQYTFNSGSAVVAGNHSGNLVLTHA